MHEIEKLIKERETVDAIVKTVCMVLKAKEKDFKTKSRERIADNLIAVEFIHLVITSNRLDEK